MRWVAFGGEAPAVVAFGAEATGVIAVGQQATGVVAFGQLATGVVAVGQLARGVFVVGQLAIGVVVVGQLVVGLAWAGGMVGVGGTGGPWLVYGLFGRSSPRRVFRSMRGTLDGPTIVDAPFTGSPRFVTAALALVLVAVAWWFAAGSGVADGLADLWRAGGSGSEVIEPPTSLPTTSRPLH